MFQLIGFIAVIYIVFKLRDKISNGWSWLASGSKGVKHTPKSDTMIYSLGNIISNLSDRERIVFRDQIDGFYNFSSGAIKPSNFSYLVLPGLVETYAIKNTVSAETKETLNKVFGLMIEAINTSPSRYSREVSLKEIYDSLKENI